jgi:2-polyprenyl-3-methyl-5-hydroxy-6-metoxy-1,4-benzoquinol methylase
MTAPRARGAAMATNPAYLPTRVEFDGCPLCDGRGTMFKTALCGFRNANTPRDITWMKCDACEHIYAKHYFIGQGRDDLLSHIAPDQMFGGQDLDITRWTWCGILQRMMPRVGLPLDGKRLIDVGIGNGGCLFTAAEMGFDAVGIDIRDDLLRTPKALGYNVECADALDYDYFGADIVMLADVLEHVAFPRALLKRVREGLKGALFVSCPNMDSVSWKYRDNQGKNVFWVDQEHYHNFTRKSLERLLRQCGFNPVEYAVSSRFQSCMEIIAV